MDGQLKLEPRTYCKKRIQSWGVQGTVVVMVGVGNVYGINVIKTHCMELSNN